jgi:hypothetical protein
MTGDGREEPPRLAYEKGEDRYKHVGRSEEPEFSFVSRNPKHYVGLCPRGIPDELKTELLNEAICDDNGDREITFPKRLHVVHEGAIYRAETTNWGKSYHAFPYRGKLGRLLLFELGKMADRKNCRRQFDNWVKIHIELHGK